MFVAKWLKVNPDVPDSFKPVFAHIEDLGMDLYVLGDHDLGPGESRDLPSGWAVEMPPGFGLRIVHRSSAPRDWGVAVIEGTIDPGYRGELKTYVENRNWKKIHIPHGTRLAQLIPQAKVYMDSVIVDALSESERGSAGFGSTGTGPMGEG
jgi:dUTP pyrophosphatase